MSIPNHLATLETSGLIRLAQLQPELEYLFRHAMVQDAAYDSLLRQDRRRLHNMVGEALEHEYPDRLTELSPLLARHFEGAGDAPRALHYLMLAGDQAAGQYANAEAIAFYSRALALIDKDASISPTLDALRDLYVRRGRVMEHRGDYVAAMQNYEAMEAAGNHRQEPALVLASLIGRATILLTANLLHNPEKGAVLLDQARELAREINDPATEARILWNLMLHETMTGGDIDRRIALGEAALEIARQHNLHETRAYVLNDMWYSYTPAGRYAEVLEGLTEATSIWRDLGRLPELAENLNRIYMVQMIMGNYDRAVEVFHEALKIGEQSSNLDAQAITNAMISWVYLDRGEFDEALHLLERAVKIGYQIGNVTAMVSEAVIGWVLAELNQLEVGLAYAERSYQFAKQNFEFLAGWPLVNMIQTHLISGNMSAAEQDMAVLGSYTGLRQRVGFVPQVWVLAALQEAEITHHHGDHHAALALCTDMLDYLIPAGIGLLVPDALFIRARAHLALGSDVQARTDLQAALDAANRVTARRTRWRILMALADQETDANQAAAYRADAARDVAFIADHAGAADRRESFLRRADVQAVIALSQSNGQ